MQTFSNRIVFVGFGFVARCTLPILVKHINVKPSQITIMEFEPDRPALEPWIAQGMRFVQEKVTRENMGTQLGQYLLHPGRTSERARSEDVEAIEPLAPRRAIRPRGEQVDHRQRELPQM